MHDQPESAHGQPNKVKCIDVFSSCVLNFGDFLEHITPPPLVDAAFAESHMQKYVSK
jgi:hypothetical protein